MSTIISFICNHYSFESFRCSFLYIKSMRKKHNHVLVCVWWWFFFLLFHRPRFPTYFQMYFVWVSSGKLFHSMNQIYWNVLCAHLIQGSHTLSIQSIKIRNTRRMIDSRCTFFLTSLSKFLHRSKQWFIIVNIHWNQFYTVIELYVFLIDLYQRP